jgi:hypothetical protein
MNAWDELRTEGARTRDPRRAALALIALLRDEGRTSERLAARRQALLAVVAKAAADVRREALA